MLLCGLASAVLPVRNASLYRQGSDKIDAWLCSALHCTHAIGHGHVHVQDLAEMDDKDAEVAGHMHSLRTQLEQCHTDLDEVEKLLRDVEEQTALKR